MITKTVPIKMVLSYAMKQGILFWVCWETETKTQSEFPNKGRAIVEQIIASEERNQEEKDYESHSQGST